MPIFLINPAPKRRAKRTPVKGTIRRVPSISRGAKRPSKKKPAARKGAKTNPQGKKKMAKKLYGAAAAARRKRLAKLKRRRGRTSNPAKPKKPKKDPKKVAAGKKGAAAKKRKAQARQYHAGASSYAAGYAAYAAKKSAAKKSAAKKKRKSSGKKKRKSTAKKRKSTGMTVAKRAAAARKGWRTRRRKGTAGPKRRRTRAQVARYGSYGLKTMKKSQKAIVRAKARRGAWRTRRYMGKHGMLRVNPTGKEGGMMGAVKQVLPIAGSFYVSRLVTNKLSDVAAVGDMMDKLKVGDFELGKPVLSGLVMAGTHFATKKGALAKQRTGLMLGTALAFVDSLVAAFAPPDVKALLGVPAKGGAANAAKAANDAADDAAKSGATPTPSSDYVAVSEYVASGGYISTSDYVPTSAYEQHPYGTSLSGYPGADEDPHGLYAVADIDEELGRIEAGLDYGNAGGIFANGW